MTFMSDTPARRSLALPPLVAAIVRKPLGAIGAVIVALLIIVAILAPLLAPFDPYELDMANTLAAPSMAHWMGTDEFGRDVLSRVIWGSRLSLFVGVLSVVLGTTVGAGIGLISGFAGGWADYVLQRLMDVLLAFPSLILALALVASLGPSTRNVVFAIALVIVPNAARVIRASVLSVRERPYVEAAQNLGLSRARVLFVHVLPNCMAPYIIIATAALGSAILSEASLSFLGLGAPPPQPSWGGLLSASAQRYMVQAPWLAIFPGLAITLVVFGFNFLGDAVRDTLDPKSRRT